MVNSPVALCAYLILAWMKFSFSIKHSLMQIIRLLQLNLFVKRGTIEIFRASSGSRLLHFFHQIAQKAVHVKATLSHLRCAETSGFKRLSAITRALLKHVFRVRFCNHTHPSICQTMHPSGRTKLTR